MAAHRYWRLNITGINGGTVCSLAEMELRTAVAGADVTGAGTPSASSTSGADVAGNVFDNNTGTYWLSTGNVPQWVQYDFGAGSPQDIVEFSVTPRTGGTSTQAQQPVEFQLQYSDDGASWTTLFGVSGETDWHLEATKTYSASRRIDEPGQSDRGWRVRASALDGGANLTIAEMQMFETGSASDACTGGQVFASTRLQGYDQEAFDDVLFDSSSYWMARNATSWIGYKLPSAKTITTISITAYTANQANAPKDFVFERWNGSAWVAAMTLTGITGWASQQTRYFNAGGETTAPVGSSARPQVFVVT